jgi:hypothetical protein
MVLGQTYLPNQLWLWPHIIPTFHRIGCKSLPYLGINSHVLGSAIQLFLAMHQWGESELCFE